MDRRSGTPWIQEGEEAGAHASTPAEGRYIACRYDRPVLLGIVGYLGIFSQANYPAFYLDDGENVAHTFLGIVALAIVFVPGLNTALAPYYRWIVILLGIVSLFFAVYGFYVGGNPAPNTFGISNLESPLDDILHLVVGVWALYAAYRAPKPAMMV